MNDHWDDTLHEAIAALEAGDTLNEVLARYPDAVDDLRPMLEMAATLSGLPSLPRPGAQAVSRQAFLELAGQMTLAERPVPRPILALGRGLIALLILVGIVAAPVAASASALPGEWLYGVKRTVEFAQLLMAGDPSARRALEDRLQQERVNEVQSLMARAGSADVQIVGRLTLDAAGGWLIEGLTVRIDGSTRVEGALSPGALARVEGRVENGVLAARQVTILTSAPATPTLPPTLAPTERATSAPEPEDTPDDAETPEPETSETDEPDATDDGDHEDDGEDDGVDD